MTLVHVCTFKKWRKVAADWDFSVDDMNVVCRRIDQKISGVPTRLLRNDNISIRKLEDNFTTKNTSFSRRSFRYRNKSGYFLTVAPVHEQYVIARAIKPHRGFVNNEQVVSIPFVIIDDSNGQVQQPLFSWKLSSSRNVAFHNLNFETNTSCTGKYTIITGPGEGSYGTRHTKVIIRKPSRTLKINTLNLTLKGKKYSSLKIQFDQRLETEDEFLAISSSNETKQSDFDIDLSDELSGVLMRYSLDQNKTTAVFDSRSITASCLTLFCGGDRVLTAEAKKLLPACRVILILDAYSLDLLHQLHLVPTANISGITPMFTYSFSHVALVTWKKFTGVTVGLNHRKSDTDTDCVQKKDEAKMPIRNLRLGKSGRHLCPVQVSIYKLKVDLTRDLQQLSSAVILRLTKPAYISRLPLPIAIQKQLLAEKRF